MDAAPRRRFWSSRIAVAIAVMTALFLTGVSPAQADSTFRKSSAPTITGSVVVGGTLTAKTGTWSPRPDSFSYQWNRNGTPITSATSAVYTLSATDLSATITVTARATKTGYSPLARTSSVTAQVAPAAFTSSPTPSISGTLAVGSTLTAATGAWSPSPDAFFYQWMRNGASIGGATSATYAVVGADAGTKITVAVTAAKSGYTPSTKTSAAKTIASAAPFSSTPTPTISGTAAVGSILTAIPGSWSPTPDSFAYQWNRGRTAIAGATSSTYQLVGADASAKITVTVTGTRAGYTPTATTSKSVSVAALMSFTSVPTPTISGTALVGSTLTASPGSWSPTPDTFSYQWSRGGTPIVGATSSSYQLVDADASAKITVTVTGTKTGYKTVSTTSSSTSVAALNSFSSAPPPLISGDGTVGATLTATPGLWYPVPDSFAFQWNRGGAPISGATSSQYQLVDADASATITVTVTARKVGYATSARTSDAITVSVRPLFVATTAPTIVGTPTVGSTLTASDGEWSPTPDWFSYQWNRNGTPIDGATGSEYLLAYADRSTEISVTVTANATGYQPTSAVSASVDVTFVDTVPTPVITGSSASDSLLYVDLGTWGAYPAQPTYQWRRDDVDIAGETSNRYISASDDIGHDITVRVTVSRDGSQPETRTSAPLRVTCGPEPAGPRVLVITSDIAVDTEWSTRDYDVVRICRGPGPSGTVGYSPSVLEGVSLTVDAGMRVEFFGTSLILNGSLNVEGNSTQPVTFVGDSLSSGIFSVNVSGSRIDAQWLNSNSNITLACGAMSISDSNLTSLELGGDGFVLDDPSQCRNSQGPIDIERSSLADDLYSIYIHGWASNVTLRDNVLAGDLKIDLNSSVKEPLRIDPRETCGHAVIERNVIGGANGLVYDDGCAGIQPTGLPALRLSNNKVTATSATFGLVQVILDDSSLMQNTAAGPHVYEYYSVTTTSTLSLPLPDSPTEYVSGWESGVTYEVSPDTTLTIAPGSRILTDGFGVMGTLVFSSDISAPGSIAASRLDSSWSLSVSDTGTATIANAQLNRVGEVRTSGSVELDSISLVDPIGDPNDSQSLQRDGVPTVITQTGGNLSVDGTYHNVSRLLEQVAGSAIVRGTFIDPSSDSHLVTTCGWDTQKCFVDARQVDWGPGGPFPHTQDGGVWAEDPAARICGTGIIWPWADMATSDDGQWIGSCDSTPTPDARMATAQTQFDDALSAFRADCAQDPDQYEDACSVVDRTLACLTSARDLAASSSTFPLEPGIDSLGPKAAEGGLHYLEAVDEPALRTPVAAEGLALQAVSVFSTLLSLANAYDSCRP